MRERQENIKVGIAITVILGIFIFGYLWLKEFHLTKKKYHYKVRLKEASWINKGDPVTIMGVPKGRVTDLKLYPDSVIVYFWVEDYPLREGATARVESQGIIGQMRISLTLGQGKILKEGATIPGFTEPDIGHVIANIGAFIIRSDSLLLEGTKVLNNLKEITTGTGEELRITLVAMREALKEARALLSDLRKMANKGEMRMDTTFNKLNRTIAELDSLFLKIRKSRGSFNYFVSDSTLYFRADSTLRALQELIKDIKEHPDRYITIKIF